MKPINRKKFLKLNLLGAISFLFSPSSSLAFSEIKTYLINCYLPKRIFIKGNNLVDIRLVKVAVNNTTKTVQFILSNDSDVTYEYSNTVFKIAERSQREAMKLKILLSYSLWKLCQTDKKNSVRYQKCNADTMQTQKFLDMLRIVEYLNILNSFKPIN